MKQPDRDWLEQYRTNPRVDSSLYRNVQNPNQWQLPGLKEAAMNTGRQQMERADAQTYEQLVAGLPEHMRNLPPTDILDYIRNAHTGQQDLAQQRTQYDANIAQRRAQMEQQNQQRLAQQRAANTSPPNIEQRAREVNENNALIQFQLRAQQAAAERQRVAAEQQRVASQPYEAQRRAEDEGQARTRQAAWDYYQWAKNNALFKASYINPRRVGEIKSQESRLQAGDFLNTLSRLMGVPMESVLNRPQFDDYYNRNRFRFHENNDPYGFYHRFNLHG